MPKTTSCRPSSAADETISSMIGIIDSAPSRPNRLVPTYFVARNFSKASAAFRRSRMRSFSSRVGVHVTPSTLDWIQRCSSMSWMCMYSMPIVLQ